jgi:flagellar basal-body rod modification protein FlgD
MDVTSVTTPTTPAPVAQPAAISSDFTTFLKMLTTQMQNQDPLNPIDSADYAVQLATFSGVEQSVKTNQLLESLGQQFGLLGMAQMAGWVGQEARADAPVWMDGDAVTLAPNPAAAADRAVLVVKNAAGDVVGREDVPVSTDPYIWHGKGITGADLPDGKYTLSLESYKGDDLLATTPMEAYAKIMEARGTPSGTVLILEGGIEVPANKITALRTAV